MSKSLEESPIDLRLVSTSMGLEVPYTPIGVSICSSTYLQFRLGDALHLYGIGVPIDAGSGTLIFGSIATDWFKIRHSADRLSRIPRLDGLEAAIAISGLVAGPFGKIDVDLAVFDELADKTNPLLQVNRQNQPASGILLFDVSMSGTLLELVPETADAGT